MSGALVARADCRHIPLAAETVDLIVTSPPYFGQRNYADAAAQIGSEPNPAEFLAELWSVMRECWRVLKPEGVAFVNLGDKRSGSGAPGTTSGFKGFSADSRVQGRRSGIEAGRGYTREAFGRAKSKQLLPHRFAIGCEDGEADPDRIGWIVRSELVWSKPNGLPESARDRPRDSHEYWFMLTKQGEYFSAVDELRRPYDGDRALSRRVNRGGENDRPGTFNQHAQWEEPDADPRGARPGSVWTIATEPLSVPEHVGVEHFAAFPTEWPRRLILGFSPCGGVVLDPFGGTGTTAMVARALGRHGVSLDLSPKYCRLARWRIFESGHNAKVESRTNADRQGTLI